jgi:hypothetical protein
VTKGKAARKWNDSRRHEMLSRRIKQHWKRRNRARASKPNIVASIRTKIAATWVQSCDRARVANDRPVWTECQYPISAAVEKQQPFLLIHGESAGINDSAVIVKGTDQRAIALERQKRAVSIPIDA